MALPEFNKKYKIESAAFPGKYLFIRPPSVPNAYFIGDGGVTVYSGANPPIIKMTPEAGNTVGFNNAEGNMFVLKTDVAGADPSQTYGNGIGTVTIAAVAGDYGRYILTENPDGTISIGSNRFRGFYIRLDGNNSIVNCASSIRGWEKFNFIPVTTKTVVKTIKSSAKWVDTGISVPKGKNLEFAASGDVKAGGGWEFRGPEGLDSLGGTDMLGPGLRGHSLIGKVGNGAPFYVGASSNTIAKESGNLFLAYNDVLTKYGDNEGSFEVTIEREV